MPNDQLSDVSECRNMQRIAVFTLHRSQHSFEYILQPKEMTRHVSEWCQPSPANLRNRSKETIVSNEVCYCKKPATKSLSLTSIYHVSNKSNATFLAKLSLDKKRDTNDKSKVSKTNKTQNNIYCQCDVKVAKKISTETQYENPVTNAMTSEIEIKTKLISYERVNIKSLAEMPKKGTVRKIVQEFDPRRNVSCQCTVKINKIDVCCQCDANITAWNSNFNGAQESNIPIEKRLSKQVQSVVTNTVSGTNSIIISMHSAAQTSDQPINLNNDLLQQYPFFMKIVCADKLCEDCIIR